MSVQEERPPGGGDWLGNALTHERARVRCLELAEQMDVKEMPADAARFREIAADARTERDHVHAQELRRAMNRSLASRRRY